MTEFDIKTEQWMTQSAFDALDKSTIPEGTEINIVGDIVESDLSVELQNKINSGGGQGGHCFKLTFDLSSYWGTGSKGIMFVPTNSMDINDIANQFIIDGVIGMDFIGTGDFGNTDPNAPYFGRLTTAIMTAIADTTNNTITISGYDIYVGSNKTKANSASVAIDASTGNTFTYTATVTKLW